MAAAFELTRPHLADRYQVTVHQVGWRLGGKGASGRGSASRIEEHGLHLWMGFYENAFRLMRECYAELARDPKTCPIAGWRDAFEPAPLSGVADRRANGSWEIWQGLLPPTDAMPGDPLPPAHRWTVVDYMVRSVELIRGLLETVGRSGQDGSSDLPGDAAEGVVPPRSSQDVRDQIARWFEYSELVSVAMLIQAVATLEMMIGSMSQYSENVVLRFIDMLARNGRAVFESRLERSSALQRVWHVIDLTLATLRGIVRFGLLTDPRGFDAVDDYDSREWLLLCGASESAVNSGWVRALYDLGFSYEDGDVERPSISAGQALRGTLRAFFTYRGSFFWRMCAGMGDVVFAPFYEVLRRRGVRFEFFHRLRNVRVAAPGSDDAYVEALEFEVQARVKAGAEYRPLIDVDGLPSWPAAPLYDQLEDAARVRQRDLESHWDRGGGERAVLRVQEDFDFVVLAVGLGLVPYVCRDLVERDPRWRAMIDHVKTVPTQAFQVWLREDMASLGWTGEPLTVSGFVEPFDTWADMRHLIAREQWPQPPKSLAYFCSVLPEHGAPDTEASDYPRRQREVVRQNAIRFLDEEVAWLWPNAVRAPGQFRWDLLVDASADAPTGRADESRFDSQFWTANVNPSDRYVTSLPGSSKYRISPLNPGCDNLTVAGDWTQCGFNAGCVEAAVMSGRLAAHAIAQSPALEDIVGYDHP